ncbi:hypothetical protein BD560DRAFT_428585 [Blakeslea trispora]|nr:hypothetical protein BD560DRAFT_428585 [Blakeslea trispora]
MSSSISIPAISSDQDERPFQNEDITAKDIADHTDQQDEETSTHHNASTLEVDEQESHQINIGAKKEEKDDKHDNDQVMVDDDGQRYTISPTGDMMLTDNGDADDLLIDSNDADKLHQVTQESSNELDQSNVSLPVDTVTIPDDTNEFFDAQESLDMSFLPPPTTMDDSLLPSAPSVLPTPLPTDTSPLGPTAQVDLPLRSFDYAYPSDNTVSTPPQSTTTETKSAESRPSNAFKFTVRVPGVTQFSSGGDVGSGSSHAIVMRTMKFLSSSQGGISQRRKSLSQRQ